MFIGPVPRAGAGVVQLDAKLEGQASDPMGHLIFGTPMQLQLSDTPSDGQHANQTRSCGLSRAAQLVLKRTML